MADYREPFDTDSTGELTSVATQHTLDGVRLGDGIAPWVFCSQFAGILLECVLN